MLLGNASEFTRFLMTAATAFIPSSPSMPASESIVRANRSRSLSLRGIRVPARVERFDPFSRDGLLIVSFELRQFGRSHLAQKLLLIIARHAIKLEHARIKFCSGFGIKRLITE